MQAQLIINHGCGICARAHPAGPHHMIGGCAAFARNLKQLIIRADIRAGIDFVIKIRRKCRGMHQLAGQLHAGKHHPPVFFSIQIIGLNSWLIIGIRRPGMDEAA